MVIDVGRKDNHWYLVGLEGTFCTSQIEHDEWRSCELQFKEYHKWFTHSGGLCSLKDGCQREEELVKAEQPTNASPFIPHVDDRILVMMQQQY